MKSKTLFENEVFKIERRKEFKKRKVAELFFKGEYVTNGDMKDDDNTFHEIDVPIAKFFNFDAYLFPFDYEMCVHAPFGDRKLCEIVYTLSRSTQNIGIDLLFCWDENSLTTLNINFVKIIYRFGELLKDAGYSVGGFEEIETFMANFTCNLHLLFKAHGDLYSRFKPHEDRFIKLFDQAYEEVRQGAKKGE